MPLHSSSSVIKNLLKTEVRSRRPRKAEAMVIVNGMIVVRLPGGKWWCNWDRFNKACITHGVQPQSVENLLEGLHLLKLIPERDYIEHIEQMKAHNHLQTRQHHEDAVKDIIE